MAVLLIVFIKLDMFNEFMTAVFDGTLFILQSMFGDASVCRKC